MYFGEPAACFKCHAVHGQGGAIGPDLSNLIHRDYASVYRDITQPSFAINPDYIPQTIILKDERVLSGVVRTDDVHVENGIGTETAACRPMERCA